MPYGALVTDRKTGEERFTSGGAPLDLNLLEFWQWYVSDLVSNATRGILAEYIVARALGVGDTGVREEWAAFDVSTPSGVRVEVKSAAYIQTWDQKRLSTITFGVRKTRGWDPIGGTYLADMKRQADVYVFALLAHGDKATIDPMNLDQWTFFVLPTAVLDGRERSQHSISLRSLQALAGDGVKFSGLAAAVEVAARDGTPLGATSGAADHHQQASDAVV